jgi:hypothetical protein
MTRQKIIFSAALLTLVCSAASRAQTAPGTAAPGGPAQPEIQKVPVVITTDYYAVTKTLVLHATNNSGKDITGFYFSIQNRRPDGTWVKQGLWGSEQDMMDMLIGIQMAKDPSAYERQMQEQGNGPFSAGTTREISMPNTNSPEVKAAADVVFYSDGTFDEQNEDEFKRMLGRRQSELLALKKVNEIVRDALSDAANDHPTEAAITKLAEAAAEAMAHNPEGPYDPSSWTTGFLQAGISNMRIIQRVAAQNMGAPSEKGKTERERLIQFVEKQEERAELMAPQCHLEISLK